MAKRLSVLLAIFVVLAFAATASAQAWRGQGRMWGKVSDESGKPLEGVTVKLFLPELNGGLETKTSKKGDWSAGGICSGGWQVDFVKEGYDTRRISVPVQQMESKPAIEITLKKSAPDPNQIVAAEMQKAAALVIEKKFADAQAIYADLLMKYPQAYQIELTIARAYHAEGAFDKEIDHLRKYLEKDPGNVEVKLLTGAMMIQKGNPAEGQALLNSIDDAAVKDPMVFVNTGINLLNQNKAKDALTFFEKAVARFPESPDAYYYRGLANIQMGTSLRPDNQAEGDKLLTAGKADLTKFLQMAPNAPEAAVAQKMLEQLK
jgi:tetratricopeptide (TPR) repeat protein